MGFLSSLFGVSDRTPATTTNVVSTKLPDELAPFVTDVLGEAQDLYKGEIERGYDPYTGQTIAPLTAEEQQAMAGIAGLAGTTTPLLQEGLQTYRQGAEKFTGDTAQQYMSPYQQAVTDIEKREAQRNFEGNILPRLEAQAVQQGAMSGLGSRAGVEMAEAQRNQAQLLADIQAKGQQKAFQDARQGFEQQKARETTMAGNVARTGPALFQAGLAEQGALQTVGEQKRQLGQSALDEAYAKFLEERNFPKQTLADYSSTIYGSAPSFNTGARSTTGTSLPGAPSTGQQLLGLGLSGLNIFGAGTAGGTKDFSLGRAFAPRAEGGQVGEELPVINRRIGGGLGDDEQGFPMDSDENIGRFIRETEDIPDTVSEAPDNATMLRQVLQKMIATGPQRTQERKDLLESFTKKDSEMASRQQKERSDFSDTSFGKREAAIKERRERYPFASIQKGIAAGMKEPTIAMMFTQGIAVTGEELEAKANELDNMIDALEQQKFGAKSKEMSDVHESNRNKLKNETDLQLKFLALDESEQQRVAALLAKGIELETALATARGKSKTGGKITAPYLNDRNAAVRNVLGYSSDFKTGADGQVVFTGKNQKGESLSDTEKKKIIEVETKYDAFYSFAIEQGKSDIAAARFAKQQILLDNKGTNTPTPPPPSGNNATIPKPSQGASNLLANPVPTFGPN
jgi:hypothetical protein